MRLIISILLLLVISILEGIATVGYAAPYIGFGIGSVHYKADMTSLGGGQVDDNSTGTKIYAGYTFNKYIAAELAAYKFSEASVDGIVTSINGVIVNNIPVHATVKSTGYAAYAVANYPLSKKINLSAKLGVLQWRADLRVNNKTSGNSGSDLAYGLQASYNFTRQLAGVAEWEGFNSANPDLSLFSVGMRFNFK